MSRPITLRRAPRRRASRPALHLLSLVALLAALLAIVPQVFAAGLSVEPSVSLGETLTDNYRLTTDGEGDAITRARAGLRATSVAGRVRGFLDYSLTGVLYASHSARNEFQNALSAVGTAELVDQRAFVDVRASISQQAVSAFGTQAPDPGRLQDNGTEVRSLSVAPYVRGKLAGRVEYEARLSHGITDSGSSLASDVTNTSASANLSGGGPVYGWGAEASRQITDFSAGRRTEVDHLRGSLRYAVDPDLVLGVNAGRESNNFVSLDKQASTTWGGRLTWLPSPRTSLAASYEHRFFGASHSVAFAHRTRRTVWNFVDSREVSVGNGQLARRTGSTYDLFFAQFASIEPDPVLRDVLVRNFLQANGIDPNIPVISEFLQAAATLQRRQLLSFALVGPRNTLTLRTTQTRSSRLDVVTGAIDDLSGADEVHQRGAAVDVAHRLTPISSANLGASWQRTTGSLDTQTSTLKAITATFTTRTGPRSNLLAGVRHVAFDSTSNPYDENALFATFSLRF